MNGLLTYDRRVLRPYKDQWKEDIESFYKAAAGRGGGTGDLRRRAAAMADLK